MEETIIIILIGSVIIAILGITLYRKMEEGVFPIRCESVQYGQLAPDPVHKRTVARGNGFALRGADSYSYYMK